MFRLEKKKKKETEPGTEFRRVKKSAQAPQDLWCPIP